MASRQAHLREDLAVPMVLGKSDEVGEHRSGDASPAPGEIGPEAYESWRRSRLGSITESREPGLVFRMAGPIDGRRLLDARRS
jgi:hypothetical protein